MAVQGKSKTPSTATVKKASTTKKAKPVVEEVTTPVATVEEVVEQAVVETPVIEKETEQVIETPVEIKEEQKKGNPKSCGTCTKKYGSVFCGSCVAFVPKK